MNISEVLARHDADVKDVTEWCDGIYNTTFAPLFNKVDELYMQMKSESTVISNEQLEWVLTQFPLELYTISEQVNKLKMECEVIKLKNKELRQKQSKQPNDAFDATPRLILENEVILTAYNAVISRVDSKLLYSREFIMGAKKVWDSRVKSTNSNPIGEVSETQPLPNYAPNIYIK